jgi:hypothetical protein
METLSPIAKFGLLALVGAFAFLTASLWAGVSADAVVGLAGAVVGAVIAASVQFITSRTEQLDRYRLAAVEKRLQAHQEAFALWRKLIAHTHQSDKIADIVMECQAWWDNNCLYLDARARKAFRTAYMCALNHNDFVKDRSNRKLVEKNWADIAAAGDALAVAVTLPPVAELVDEYKKEALSDRKA